MKLTPQFLKDMLYKLEKTRLRFCHENGLSRYRMYLFEKGLISLKPAEETKIKEAFDLHQRQPLKGEQSEKKNF